MPVVLDTSFIVATQNEREEHHEEARAIMARIHAGDFGEALLHEYVFLETVTVLAARKDFQTAVRTGNTLLQAAGTRFVQASEHFAAVWNVFQHQPRGKWSFTDAALVALAQATGATHIATFDKDLRKVEGLKAIP